MGLYGIAMNEAGTETWTGQYTVAAAEKDAKINQELEIAGTEIDSAANQTVVAEQYLGGLGKLISVDGAIMGDNAGTEIHKVVMGEYLKLGATIIATGEEVGLAESGTEGKISDYYQKALVLARKAWVNVKKIAMKAIAKLIGYVNFRTGKIEDLESKIKDDDLTYTAKEFEKDDYETLLAMGPVFGKAMSSAGETGKLLSDLMAGYVSASDEYSSIGENFVSREDALEKVTKSGLTAKNIKAFSEDVVQFVKDADKTDLLFGIMGVRAVRYFVKDKESGKVSYTKVAYADVAASLHSVIKPMEKDGMENVVAEVKSANKSFSKKVGSMFKNMESASKAMDTGLTAFQKSSKSDSDKRKFNTLKSLYSTAPRFAFDAVLDMNRVINFGIAIVETGYKAHAKEADKTN